MGNEVLMSSLCTAELLVIKILSRSINVRLDQFSLS